MKFSSLPRPLILLSTHSVLAAQTIPNDPFRTIALERPKLGQDPICCLIPLPPTEPQPTEDELLLSFEDWKAKLLAEERSNSAAGSSGDGDSASYAFRTDPIQAMDGSGNGGNEGEGAEGKDDRTYRPSALHSNIPSPNSSGQTLPQDQFDFGFGEPTSRMFALSIVSRSLSL